eukprot:COSAG01_NODE_11243_length_1974_cov_1.644800_1_plen_226_part_10
MQPFEVLHSQQATNHPPPFHPPIRTTDIPRPAQAMVLQADPDSVTDADFAEGARFAARGVGDSIPRESFLKIHTMWLASVASSHYDDGIGDVDLRQMAACRLITYQETWPREQTKGETTAARTMAPAACDGQQQQQQQQEGGAEASESAMCEADSMVFEKEHQQREEAVKRPDEVPRMGHHHRSGQNVTVPGRCTSEEDLGSEDLSEELAADAMEVANETTASPRG